MRYRVVIELKKGCFSKFVGYLGAILVCFFTNVLHKEELKSLDIGKLLVVLVCSRTCESFRQDLGLGESILRVLISVC